VPITRGAHHAASGGGSGSRQTAGGSAARERARRAPQCRDVSTDKVGDVDVVAHGGPIRRGEVRAEDGEGGAPPEGGVEARRRDAAVLHTGRQGGRPAAPQQASQHATQTPQYAHCGLISSVAPGGTECGTKIDYQD
jgi:hypothetical protein